MIVPTETSSGSMCTVVRERCTDGGHRLLYDFLFLSFAFGTDSRRIEDR